MSIPIVYVKDKEQFFDLRTRKYISEKEAKNRLLQYQSAWSGDTVNRVLQESKETGLLSTQIMKSKKIPLHEMYEEVQDLIPFRYYVTPTLETINYQVREGNEAIVIAGNDDDKLFNGIVKYDSLYKAFKEKFDTSEYVKNLKNQIQFEDYMNAIFKKYRKDPSKQLVREPDLLSWDEDVLAFRQMNPLLLREAETPTWDEFLTRVDFPEIFMAWVWSVFEPENKTRQVMWLRGEGNDGKSSVMNALSEIYGRDASATLGQGSETQQWFHSTIYGKRFVTYADCANPHLIAHPKIKQATTGDRVPIEYKNENAFHGYVYAKFLVSSNKMPKIDLMLDAETSRLIKLEVARPATDSRDYGFQKRLIEEGYAFLHKCRLAYEKHVDQDKKVEIILPEKLVQKIEADCASTDFNILSEFIDANLEFGPNYYYKLAEFRKDIGMFLAEYNEPSRSVPYYIDGFCNRKKKLNFTEERVKLPTTGHAVSVFVGFRKKGSKESL